MSKRPLNRPATQNTMAYGFKVNARAFGPFSYCETFAPKFQEMVVRSISVLFFRCGPFTIIGSIAGIIVNTLKGHSAWFIPHVGKKVLKRVFPSFADNDSAIEIVRPVTSLLHMRPRSICGAMGSPMFGVATTYFNARFRSKTSTAFCKAMAQGRATYQLFISAIALASPLSFIGPRLDALYYHKTANAESSHVYC